MTTETLRRDALVEQTRLEESEEMSFFQGVLISRLTRYLGAYVDEQKLGYVAGDGVEFEVPGLGTKTKKPDAAFVEIAKMVEPSDEAVVPFSPTLAVEIVSRTDIWKAVFDKAYLYVEKGSKLVWVIDPYNKNVFVFRIGRKFTVLYSNDELDGEDVIPGFKLAVNSLF